jgi:hypothetical protein
MEKYLFNDGINGVREVQSREELQQLAENADSRLAKVWVYSSNEWISLAEFSTLFPAPAAQKRNGTAREKGPPQKPAPRAAQKSFGTGFRLLLGAALSLCIFLVYNFTRDKWEPMEEIRIRPARPENAPLIDVDSLITQLEAGRGQRLDKTTRTNLRIRNNWPDQILLSAQVRRDSSKSGIRYHDIEFVLDNATGYQLDELELEWAVWRGNDQRHKGELRFENIDYSRPARQSLPGIFVGDSMSIRIRSIRAASFHFCYSHDKQSNYGNLNDRWFCR